MGIFKVHPVNEDFTLNEITLKLTSGIAADLSQVYVYRGSTLLGTVPLQNGSPATAPLTPSQ